MEESPIWPKPRRDFTAGLNPLAIGRMLIPKGD